MRRRNHSTLNGRGRGPQKWLLVSNDTVEEGGDFKTLVQGAATSVWCATSPQLFGIGGVYCQDTDIAPMLPAGSESVIGARDYAVDPQLAQRLWTLSEKLTQLSF